MHKLVLASGSPRRKELLAQLGYTFDVVLPDIEECKAEQETTAEYVLRLSQQKAQAGLALVSESSIVVGSDTVVVCDGQVLEKPHHFADAQRMLTQLSDRRHQVMTAVTVVSAEKQHSVVVTTEVWFKKLTQEEIEQYWQSGEPCDKAGSYGIQGLGGRFVTRIEGSYSAVVGLPLYETDQLLHEFI
ncbi:Maf family protein [Vibrio vulnificus]|uniref:Maf family protein n=1 Tax=Vibrio vulnificus TaxID=672 RepID=UPI0005044D25|nr:Maf family protein [Vibrio vulnificus]ASJ37564.1 septum formation protein Maf [Vibrio vulnificus]EGR0353172.1 septum formation inhibitor Maf [Vibrio vulnificus]EGR0639983.1 septum formation inhibitor Maf [Vibrio vulnificus]EGR0648956.1 septum formation inhibitor Maf [Vibrio vulnificus]EGR9009582.1 septum formation inhibitor Maf [Vibrio vulnificus]